MPNHIKTKKIGGDSIDLFLVFQVERETVMTAWRLHWGIRELGLLIKCYVFENNEKIVLIDT